MNAKNKKILRYDSPAFTLTLHLFRQCLDELSLDSEQAEILRIKEFYAWLQIRREQHSFLDDPMFPDKDELQEFWGIGDSTFTALGRIFSDPFETCERVHPWWPLLSLAARRPLQHPIAGIKITLEINYEGGNNVVIPMPLGQQDEPYTSGMILTLWRAQLSQAINSLADIGFDNLYEDHCTKPDGGGVIDMNNNKKNIGGMGL